MAYDVDVLEKASYHAYGADLLAGTIWENSSKSDAIAAARTLIRHDPLVVARSIIELYSNRTTAS